MKPCRECGQPTAPTARACPTCGILNPVQQWVAFPDGSHDTAREPVSGGYAGGMSALTSPPAPASQGPVGPPPNPGPYGEAPRQPPYAAAAMHGGAVQGGTRQAYPLSLSFKLLALAPQITVTDSSGALLFYVKQKAF